MSLEFQNQISIQPQEESGGGGGSDFIGIPRELNNGKLQIPQNTTSFTLPESITDIGDWGLCYAFHSVSNLTEVKFPNLISLSGDHAMYDAFLRTGVTNVVFPKLESITGRMALGYAFDGCLSLQSVSFPALKTIGTEYTNQFVSMVFETPQTVTIHFPSNMQSVLAPIMTQAGTRPGDTSTTTVLYDLPATA